MRITVERSLDAASIDAFYPLYRTAFAPMATRAAARHLLDAQEFAEEMSDDRIDKYVAWNEAGAPIALTTFTGDLHAVPWISPEFYAQKYPREFAAGTLFYLGYTLIDRDLAGPGTFAAVMQRLVERMTAVQGVCVFDVCAYNDERAVGRMWDRLN